MSVMLLLDLLNLYMTHRSLCIGGKKVFAHICSICKHILNTFTHASRYIQKEAASLDIHDAVTQFTRKKLLLHH